MHDAQVQHLSSPTEHLTEFIAKKSPTEQKNTDIF